MSVNIYNPIENKGDLMKLIFTKKELRNIDSAIPVEIYLTMAKTQDSTFLVMNYNENHVFGKLENLLQVAYDRNITVAVPLPDEYNRLIH